MAKAILILMLSVPQVLGGTWGSRYLCFKSDGSFCCIDDGPEACDCCTETANPVSPVPVSPVPVSPVPVSPVPVSPDSLALNPLSQIQIQLPTETPARSSVRSGEKQLQTACRCCAAPESTEETLASELALFGNGSNRTECHSEPVPHSKPENSDESDGRIEPVASTTIALSINQAIIDQTLMNQAVMTNTECDCSHILIADGNSTTSSKRTVVSSMLRVLRDSPALCGGTLEQLEAFAIGRPSLHDNPHLHSARTMAGIAWISLRC